MKRGFVIVLAICSASGIYAAQDNSVELGLSVEQAAKRVQDPALLAPASSKADEGAALLSVKSSEHIQKKAQDRVKYVYGVSADDYLPNKTATKATYRPKVRSKYSGISSKEIPDAVYLVGGPVLLTILLGLMVSFIKEFENQQREEMVEAASERFNPE